MNFGELLAYWPALALAGVVLVAAGGAYLWMNRRPTAAELERRRREMINRIGKMGDGTITEWEQPLVLYNYHARGIEYEATQDLSGLEAHLPPEQWGMVGPVSIKYDPRNPANSIVISEKWSGLRKPSNSKVNL
jgi:hypothetical protein